MQLEKIQQALREAGIGIRRLVTAMETAIIELLAARGVTAEARTISKRRSKTSRPRRSKVFTQYSQSGSM